MTQRFLTLSLLSAVFALPACATPVPASEQSLSAQTQSTPPVSQTVRSAAAERAEEMSQERRFEAWKVDFISRARARGYSDALLAQTVATAEINPKALERDQSQPEFTRPIWEYIEGAASETRILNGQTELDRNRTLFDQLEADFGVPRYILTAIWGLESAYGEILGTHDIISALATFAFEGRRVKFGEEQLFATLDLLKSGAVRQDQLIGSWAGAMGMTQFIPTTFRDYAVDYDASGNKDLWQSEGDALGSAANYLKRSGWRTGEPVIAEVDLPANFDFSLSDGRKMSVAQWQRLGAVASTGQNFSQQALVLEAKLLVPTGGDGPKLLTFKNYDVIKRYNNSTSYVLGITSLANAFTGQETITRPWPKGSLPISFTDRKRLQEALTRIGYDTQGVDGQIGPNTRKAIRAFQSANGLPADGYATEDLLNRVLSSRN